MADWHALRQQMCLEPTITNLNTGSFGPLSRCVFDEVTRLRKRLAEEPMDFLLRQSPLLLWQARKRLADFLGGRPDRLVFTSNVTAAVNLVADSMQLAAPGEILLTDHEYGAMQWCWERAAQRQGLTIRTWPMPTMADDPQQIVDCFVHHLNERTRLAFFSHVLSPTGLVLPVKEMTAQARRRGVVTVIDGAHAPAMVPLNVEEIDADFYGGNCHKWLLAPTGAGFLYLGHGSEDRLQPLQVSWGFRPDRSCLDLPDAFGSTPRLRCLEFEGTRDVCPWLAVPAALNFQKSIGFEAIRSRNEHLVSWVRQRIGSMRGVSLATPTHSALCGFMTAFRIHPDRLPPGALDFQLRESFFERFRIELPFIEKPAGMLVRVSTHFYNTHQEIDCLLAALGQFLVK